MSAHFSRLAQRMLANIGCDRIDDGEVTIHGVRLILSRRGIHYLNEAAKEQEERLQNAVMEAAAVTGEDRG
jgi:hypothetical protein